ncbi:MAG: hypothetical protein J6Y13_02970 [Treponema sp.]|nr:hypothetical protein [Treponema sp.]
MKRSAFIVCGLFLSAMLLPLGAQNSLTGSVTTDDNSVTGTVSGGAGSASVTISGPTKGDIATREKGGVNPATGKSTASVEAPPSSFGNVSIGMDIESVKQALLADRRFGYRGERDVSLLAGENNKLIETDAARYSPYPYLDRCWFQFVDDKLYVMSINLNQEKLDHYSVFSALCEKYGAPTTLNPDKAEWVSDSMIVDLERPLCLKYTDKLVFDRIQAESGVEETVAEQNREQFLQGI